MPLKKSRLEKQPKAEQKSVHQPPPLAPLSNSFRRISVVKVDDVFSDSETHSSEADCGASDGFNDDTDDGIEPIHNENDHGIENVMQNKCFERRNVVTKPKYKVLKVRVPKPHKSKCPKSVTSVPDGSAMAAFDTPMPMKVAQDIRRKTWMTLCSWQMV